MSKDSDLEAGGDSSGDEGAVGYRYAGGADVIAADAGAAAEGHESGGDGSSPSGRVRSGGSYLYPRKIADVLASQVDALASRASAVAKTASEALRVAKAFMPKPHQKPEVEEVKLPTQEEFLTYLRKEFNSSLSEITTEREAARLEEREIAPRKIETTIVEEERAEIVRQKDKANFAHAALEKAKTNSKIRVNGSLTLRENLDKIRTAFDDKDTIDEALRLLGSTIDLNAVPVGVDKLSIWFRQKFNEEREAYIKRTTSFEIGAAESYALDKILGAINDVPDLIEPGKDLSDEFRTKIKGFRKAFKDLSLRANALEAFDGIDINAEYDFESLASEPSPDEMLRRVRKNFEREFALLEQNGYYIETIEYTALDKVRRLMALDYPDEIIPLSLMLAGNLDKLTEALKQPETKEAALTMFHTVDLNIIPISLVPMDIRLRNMFSQQLTQISRSSLKPSEQKEYEKFVLTTAIRLIYVTGTKQYAVLHDNLQKFKSALIDPERKEIAAKLFNIVDFFGTSLDLDELLSITPSPQVLALKTLRDVFEQEYRKATPRHEVSAEYTVKLGDDENRALDKAMHLVIGSYHENPLNSTFRDNIKVLRAAFGDSAQRVGAFEILSTIDISSPEIKITAEDCKSFTSLIESGAYAIMSAGGASAGAGGAGAGAGTGGADTGARLGIMGGGDSPTSSAVNAAKVFGEGVMDLRFASPTGSAVAGSPDEGKHVARLSSRGQSPSHESHVEGERSRSGSPSVSSIGSRDSTHVAREETRLGSPSSRVP